MRYNETYTCGLRVSHAEERTVVMLEISNLEEWTREYFSSPVNQQKAEKACERYDRLMVKNIRRQLSMGVEQIHVIGEEVDDPGKVLEKAKYEVLPSAKLGDKTGKIRINLLDRTAEFIQD